jgi:hypothetical protein
MAKSVILVQRNINRYTASALSDRLHWPALGDENTL